MAETEVEFKQALDVVAKCLALRDHSLHELKTKLSRKFEPEMVTRVLGVAEARGWLCSEEKVAEQLAAALHRRGKSLGYINGQLRKRKLPVVEMSSDEELTKARDLLVRRFGEEKLSYEERTKAYRYLKYRGFEDRWIRKALNNEQPDE